MGQKRACVKYKVVKVNKGKRWGARCVEFKDGKKAPNCPTQGLVTFGRSQYHIRGSNNACRGVAPRKGPTSAITIMGPIAPRRRKARRASR